MTTQVRLAKLASVRIEKRENEVVGEGSSTRSVGSTG